MILQCCQLSRNARESALTLFRAAFTLATDLIGLPCIVMREPIGKRKQRYPTCTLTICSCVYSCFANRPLQGRESDIERTTVRTVMSLSIETDGYACFHDISGSAGARGCLINVDPSKFPVAVDLVCPGCGGPSVAAVSLCTVRVKGNGFLTHQVRRMVAALVEVGLSRWSVDDVAKLLRGEGTKPERAPPHGLCMWRLNLDENANGLPRAPRRHARTP